MTAASAADDALAAFLTAMAAAGNPGSGRHELGMHHVHGWIVSYDGTQGGAEVQAVIGVDGCVHARRSSRSLRAPKLTASEWLEHLPGATEEERLAAFTNELDALASFNGVTPAH